ncbi:hypothetical protein BD289DRAFT_216260 [Coniella lustricola]|uniref:Uncharacterized protein n=1 Tax=Coniella lustricola TaxID=2025994 RepID=A0A2T3AB94_9PEZI|nr:hypothetical protein BD289DRAFT_216260 [Coniella lustricola]
MLTDYSRLLAMPDTPHCEERNGETTMRPRIKGSRAAVACSCAHQYLSHEYLGRLRFCQTPIKMNVPLSFSPDTALAGGPGIPVYRCREDDPRGFKQHGEEGTACALNARSDDDPERAYFLVVAPEGQNHYPESTLGCGGRSIYSPCSSEMSNNHTYELV